MIEGIFLHEGLLEALGRHIADGSVQMAGCSAGCHSH